MPSNWNTSCKILVLLHARLWSNDLAARSELRFKYIWSSNTTLTFLSPHARSLRCGLASAEWSLRRFFGAVNPTLPWEDGGHLCCARTVNPSFRCSRTFPNSIHCPSWGLSFGAVVSQRQVAEYKLPRPCCFTVICRQEALVRSLPLVSSIHFAFLSSTIPVSEFLLGYGF